MAGDYTRSVDATSINPLLKTSQIQRLHWPGMTRGKPRTLLERILKSNLRNSPVQWSLTTDETDIWTVTIKRNLIRHSISSRIWVLNVHSVHVYLYQKLYRVLKHFHVLLSFSASLLLHYLYSVISKQSVTL